MLSPSVQSWNRESPQCYHHTATPETSHSHEKSSEPSASECIVFVVTEYLYSYAETYSDPEFNIFSTIDFHARIQCSNLPKEITICHQYPHNGWTPVNQFQKLYIHFNQFTPYDGRIGE